MNRKLSFLFLLMTLYTFAQNEQLIDRPVKYLPKDHYFKTYLEKDTILEVQIIVESLYLAHEDRRIPAIYTVYMHQDFQGKYHRIVIIECGDSIYSSRYGGIIPEHCSYWGEPDSNVVYFQLISDGEFIGGKSQGNRPDSVLHYDYECVDEFYQSQSDSIRVDTLFKEKGTYLDDSSDNDIPFWECEYYFELKHGKEIGYYHLNETKGKCINIDANLKKYEGKWKYGKKKGKWCFYDVYGVLTRIEFYRKGQCQRINHLN